MWNGNERYQSLRFEACSAWRRAISRAMKRSSPRVLRRRSARHHSGASKYEPPWRTRSGASWGTGYSSQRRCAGWRAYRQARTAVPAAATRKPAATRP